MNFHLEGENMCNKCFNGGHQGHNCCFPKPQCCCIPKCECFCITKCECCHCPKPQCCCIPMCQCHMGPQCPVMTERPEDPRSKDTNSKKR